MSNTNNSPTIGAFVNISSSPGETNACWVLPEEVVSITSMLIEDAEHPEQNGHYSNVTLRTGDTYTVRISPTEIIRRCGFATA